MPARFARSSSRAVFTRAIRAGCIETAGQVRERYLGRLND
jgi:hypothetical protein